MTSVRKPLNEILGKYSETGITTADCSETAAPPITAAVQSENSLTSQLANPKKKITKIRFTLDLDKPLDERLNKSARQLNRSKADLARIALERLLDELDQEWKQ